MGLAWSETGALWGKEGASLQDNGPERKKDEADTATVKTPLRKTAMRRKGKASKNKDTAQGHLQCGREGKGGKAVQVCAEKLRLGKKLLGTHVRGEWEGRQPALGFLRRAGSRSHCPTPTQCPEGRSSPVIVNRPWVADVHSTSHPPISPSPPPMNQEVYSELVTT